MAYDWTGGRTRRLRRMKLGAAASSLILLALLTALVLGWTRCAQFNADRRHGKVSQNRPAAAPSGATSILCWQVLPNISREGMSWLCRRLKRVHFGAEAAARPIETAN